MSSSLGLRLFIFRFLAAVAVRGQVPLPNAVIQINGQTKLDCHSTTNNLPASNWRHSSDGTNFITIAIGCNNVTGSNAAYYRTEVIGGNMCRLIIANVTMQQAGVYVCYDGATTTFQSLVTVIDPIASIVVYNQSEVVDGDQLNISCSLNYTGPASPAPSLRPSPYWTTSPGQIFTSYISHPTTNVVTLVATVTVQKPTVPVFQCKTVFEITGTTSGYNPTPPPDNLTVGSTTELDVQYSPYNLTINGTNCTNNFCTCNGNASYADPISITCMANGIPIPSVEWRSDNPFDGLYETIAVTLNGNYTCMATNTYGGKPYSAEQTVVVSDCLDPASISPTTSTMANTNATTGSTSNNVAAIVMGVLFGISLVINIILLIMLIRKHDSSKRKENIPEPQLPYHSETFPPAAYEELRPNDGIHLQPTTYEQLTHRPPLYVNHVS